MVIKAVLEKISSVAPILEVENIRSPKYQQQEEQQFKQFLENSERKLRQQQESIVDKLNERSSGIGYVFYDMEANVNWQTKNNLDIKG